MVVTLCQIGAREHYAIARLLHREGLLDRLVTDLWVLPGRTASLVPGDAGARLRGRYHPDLRGARVTHFTASAVFRRVTAVRRTMSRWPAIVDHNSWFQSKAAGVVRDASCQTGAVSRPIVLAYSYAALSILQAARDIDASTVLCQIDGGVVEEQLVYALSGRGGRSPYDCAPLGYWRNWRQECELADRIIVNSQWSRSLLEAAGIDGGKIRVVPVLYDQPSSSRPDRRSYPPAFTGDRPLEVLFLGQLTARKGIPEAMEAARQLGNEPVRWTFVGPDPEGRIERLRTLPNAVVKGHIPRSEVAMAYAQADVFLFPTHSDGFGLTQLEAQAAGVPVIASQNCASVVDPGVTGLVLDEVSAEAIVAAIGKCLQNPAQLAEMSRRAPSAAAAFARRGKEEFLAVLRTFDRPGT